MRKVLIALIAIGVLTLGAFAGTAQADHGRGYSRGYGHYHGGYGHGGCGYGYGGYGGGYAVRSYRPWYGSGYYGSPYGHHHHHHHGGGLYIGGRSFGFGIGF